MKPWLKPGFTVKPFNELCFWEDPTLALITVHFYRILLRVSKIKSGILISTQAVAFDEAGLLGEAVAEAGLLGEAVAEAPGFSVKPLAEATISSTLLKVRTTYTYLQTPNSTRASQNPNDRAIQPVVRRRTFLSFRSPIHGLAESHHLGTNKLYSL